jgi:hypothetical protein
MISIAVSPSALSASSVGADELHLTGDILHAISLILLKELVIQSNAVLCLEYIIYSATIIE